MAHTITAYSKVQKVKDEPKFEVTNRKERRRIKSKKKAVYDQSPIFKGKHGLICRD
jgi:hypothetical protein